MKLENYILNKNKTLNELLKYGIINGGGNYSVEYAMGNYIYFNPIDFSFIKTCGWYKNVSENYQELLENKIKQLIDNEIILDKGE